MTQDLTDILFEALEASIVWKGFRSVYVSYTDPEAEPHSRRNFAEYLTNVIKDSTNADSS